MLLFADTTVGLWMVLFNPTYFEDLRLCQNTCSDSSVIVSVYKCTGLCNPTEDQRKLWADPQCSAAPTLPASVDDDATHRSKIMENGTVNQREISPAKLEYIPAPWKDHAIFEIMQHHAVQH